MALLLAVVCGLLAYAHGGMIQSMGGYEQGHGMQMVPMGNGCNEDSNGQMPTGCAIPQMQIDNMNEYLQQQMEQQQYDTQAMAERIKAQFEGMVKNVTKKKLRFAMSLVTEFISFCQCGQSSTQIRNAIFVEQAKTLNLTDPMDNFDTTRPPYQAKSEEEARGLIFAGLLRSMCESAGTYLTFVDEVNKRIPAYQGRK